MDIIVSFIGHFSAAAGAAIAIVGNTWDTSRIGWRKITSTGLIAGTVVIVAFFVSSYGSYKKYQDEKERRRVASEAIDSAWSGLMAPFKMLLWEIDGQQSEPDLDMAERLLEKNTITAVNQVDLRGDAPHYHGPWRDNLSGSTKRGISELKQAQVIYVGIIDTDLIKAMHEVTKCYYPDVMTILPDIWEQNYANSQQPITLNIAVTNERSYETYLKALRNLKIEIDKSLK